MGSLNSGVDANLRYASSKLSRVNSSHLQPKTYLLSLINFLSNMKPKFEIKKKLNQTIANMFTKKIEKFKNRHFGETCYIIGDGPSIKWFDLSLFNEYPAICCGLMPFHKDFKKIDARYLLEIEPWLFTCKMFQPKILHKYQEIAAEIKKKINDKSLEVFVNLSNRFSLRGENINYIYRMLPNPKSNIEKEINNNDFLSGSFHASLSLAHYMGFRKIYLIGFDGWTIQPQRGMHWYEYGPGEIFYSGNFAVDFLTLLKSDLDIYTISKEGVSCNVININYEELTGKEIKYKENYELIDNYMLDVIDTFPFYKVFPDRPGQSKISRPGF